MSDETTWRERALRAEKEIGDAWEVMGQDRAGATSGRVELGPVGGPYVTVEEDRTLTLPEFLANVTVGLEEQQRYLDDVKAERDHLRARTVTTGQFEAAAARIRRVYLGDRIRNHTREEARILVAAVLQAAGFTTPEE